MTRQPIPRFLPLKDIRQLASLQGALIVLWIIQQHGPLNFAALLDSLFTIGADREGARSTGMINIINALRGLLEATGQLYECGLITVDADELADAQAKALRGDFKTLVDKQHSLMIAVSPSLEVVTELFGLDLFVYASGKGDAQPIDPIFGKPTSVDALDVFTILPFADDLKPTVEGVEACIKQLGLIHRRGNDVFSDEKIIRDSWNDIFSSRLCIAECTGRDPNVFYEIGIAHTLGRPCIIIAQSINDVPFDVRHRRVIIYNNTPDGMARFQDTLTRTLADELGIERAKLT